MKIVKKIPCIYESENPNNENVAFVAIQTQTEPPYVWAVYSKDNRLLPKGRSNMTIMSIEAAREVFDFKEGKLADLVIKRE